MEFYRKKEFLRQVIEIYQSLYSPPNSDSPATVAREGDRQDLSFIKTIKRKKKLNKFTHSTK